MEPLYIWTIGSVKKQMKIEQVDHKNGVYSFEASKSDTGIILYPGAKVEPLAYAYLGNALMKKGYSVFIPDMPFSFAIFNTKKAEDILKVIQPSSIGTLADIR